MRIGMVPLPKRVVQQQAPIQVQKSPTRREWSVVEPTRDLEFLREEERFRRDQKAAEVKRNTKIPRKQWAKSYAPIVIERDPEEGEEACQMPSVSLPPKRRVTSRQYKSSLRNVPEENEEEQEQEEQICVKPPVYPPRGVRWQNPLQQIDEEDEEEDSYYARQQPQEPVCQVPARKQWGAPQQVHFEKNFFSPDENTAADAECPITISIQPARQMWTTPQPLIIEKEDSDDDWEDLDEDDELLCQTIPTRVQVTPPKDRRSWDMPEMGLQSTPVKEMSSSERFERIPREPGNTVADAGLPTWAR